MVQRLTAWVTGTPVLQLVTKKEIPATTPRPAFGSEGKSKRQKQKRVPSQEDEEMYKTLKDGKNFERNKRQEDELEKLKQGISVVQVTRSLTQIRTRLPGNQSNKCI